MVDEREDNEDTGETKVCSKCNLSKRFDQFNADGRRGDGKRASCKDCDSKLKKSIRDANLQLYRSRNRANNKKLRDKRREGSGSDGRAT